jgi:hypothetical protein
MNFKEMQDRLAFILNAHSNQVDQDFTVARYKQALNYAYNREVQKAMLEGVKEYWKEQQTISWPANQQTLSLPANIKKKTILRIHDVTHNDIGEQLYFDKYGLTDTVFFKDTSTLQWGTVGPNEAKTLRVYYLAYPEELVTDDDEPSLVPEAFQEVIIWAAAVWMKSIVDDSAPDSWQQQLFELRQDFWKYVSMGRPRSDEPMMSLRDSDFNQEIISI